MSGIEVVGAEPLAAAFSAAASSSTTFHRAQVRGAELIATRARQRAPRRTGRLRSSISASTEPGASVVTVGVSYGRPQEFGWRTGWRTVPGRHFVTGAVAETEAERVDAYVSDAEDLCNQIASSTP
jgi:hypothetical protein